MRFSENLGPISTNSTSVRSFSSEGKTIYKLSLELGPLSEVYLVVSEPDLVVCYGERVHMIMEWLGFWMVIWSSKSFNKELFHELKMKSAVKFLIALY